MMKTMSALVVLVMLAGTAQAQRAGMNPLRQLPLTAEDMEAVRVVVTKLTEEQRIGETAEWSNPQSGNSGKATLHELFEQDGYSCRRVGHQVRIKGRADPTQLEFKTCLDPRDDTWKLIG